MREAVAERRPAVGAGERRLTERRIRVLLAYRQTLLRQALRTLLLSLGDVDVLAEAQDGKDAVEKAEQLQPDIAVVDAALPVLDGLEATRLIRKRAQQVKVLLLSAGADAEDVLRVLQAGAAGCLPKEADATELREALSSLARGRTYLSPLLAERLVQSYLALAQGATPPPPPERCALTVREREVLQLAAEGHSNREIARRLCISVKTVEAHKAHMLRKLGLRSQTELLKYAIRKGLVRLDDEPVATPGG